MLSAEQQLICRDVSKVDALPPKRPKRVQKKDQPQETEGRPFDRPPKAEKKQAPIVTEGNPFDQHNELQAFDCKFSNGQIQVSYKDPSDLNPQQVTFETNKTHSNTIMLPKDLTETEQERYLQKMMKMQASHEDKLDKGKDRLERKLLKFSHKMERKALRNQERSLRREMQEQGVTEGG